MDARPDDRGTDHVRHFQEELEQLKTRLLEMGGLAEDRVRVGRRGARRARSGRSSTRCWPATSRSTSCTSRSTTAASSCWRCTSRWPSTCASIVAAVKINTDLERVGDLAVNIAEAGARYLRHPPVKQLIDIPRMADIAQAHAARRARRLRPPRHRRSRSRSSTRTTSSTR